VLLISAKSLVLLKNYVKILKLEAAPAPEIGNPQTASFIHGTVFYLLAKLRMLASLSGEHLALADGKLRFVGGKSSLP
jgi:hypothetical protein